MLNYSIESLKEGLAEFLSTCRLDTDAWRFSSVPDGAETLYASSFAVMLLHYLGELDKLSPSQKSSWANYLLSWQEEGTGLFIGPELSVGEINSPKHSREHIAHHLTAHVLPALDLLGVEPTYPLTFMQPFLNPINLRGWLNQRDWQEAWLEGNNLLFIGQFLVHLRDVEGSPRASTALNQLFDWLDGELDHETGLWGTNGYCRNEVALYGGYHQLLLYYHEARPVASRKCLVDIALSLQGPDGSFDPHGRGSACQDTDTIDVLVNMYKLGDYKRPQIRIALRRALEHVLNMRELDGGFVNRKDEQFTHMGVLMTRSEPGISNMFPTWFRTHSLALLSEILKDEFIADHTWGFNRVFSMGWHRRWSPDSHTPSWWEQAEEELVLGRRAFALGVGVQYRRLRRFAGSVKRRLLPSS